MQQVDESYRSFEGHGMEGDEGFFAFAGLYVFETFVPWYPYFSFVLPPVLSGKEHVRLYEEAVTVTSAATDAVS
ncbi:hypothetical protein ACC785_38770, partial [Rhizobium ruizarguesonis]